jgi:LmbE family N-acetylglucosaminyl deacetylase
MTVELGKKIAVVSPHLDDAALSLGGTIARAVREGADVRVVTVFAYDPETTAPNGEWDATCGFRSAREAAAVRRAEDRRACEFLGARPVWLPFDDDEHTDRLDPDAIRSALAEAVEGAETVFVPGFPLAVPDHVLVTKLLLEQPPPSARMALYVEQPYATWRVIGRGRRTGAEGLSSRKGITNALRITLRTRSGRRLQEPFAVADVIAGDSVRWSASPLAPRDWWAKQRAVRAYKSQVRGFGPLVLPRMIMYESSWGGEAIAPIILGNGGPADGARGTRPSTAPDTNSLR